MGFTEADIVEKVDLSIARTAGLVSRAGAEQSLVASLAWVTSVLADEVLPRARQFHGKMLPKVRIDGVTAPLFPRAGRRPEELSLQTGDTFIVIWGCFTATAGRVVVESTPGQPVKYATEHSVMPTTIELARLNGVTLLGDLLVDNLPLLEMTYLTGQLIPLSQDQLSQRIIYRNSPVVFPLPQG